MNNNKGNADMSFDRINRRSFLQRTAAFTAGVLALRRGLFADSGKSTVIEVHRPGVMRPDNRPDPVAVREMLDRGMKALTGEPSVRGQWSRFVTPEDVVGLKVNGLGGPLMSTKHELVRAVIEALRDSGVKPGNIVVFDRYAEHLKAVVLKSRLEDLGVMVISSEEPGVGFDEAATVFESGSTHLTRILTGRITAMINLPIVKDHEISGTTISLKNLSHGLTDKPWEFHGNNCDPYIAHVNALPAITKKHKLVIADGLLGCCDGGPDYKSDGIVKYESLLFSTDRVALDTVATGIIEAARERKGFPSLARAGRPPKYLLTAEKIGLGNHDKTRIEHRIVE
jgi:uncharacterized protein (DUF362 family)